MQIYNYKKMKQKHITRIILVIFAVIIICSYIKFKKDQNNLKSSGMMTIAKVTGDKLTKNTYLIKYSFWHKNRIYNDMKSDNQLDLDDVDRLLVNKTFPLILFPSDPNNNDLLLFKEDFERYNLAYPDSLKWICDSLKLDDCK
jgi:hypothetical protein